MRLRFIFLTPRLAPSTSSSLSGTMSGRRTTYYSRWKRTFLPQKWRDSLELKVVEDFFFPTDEEYVLDFTRNFFVGCRKAVCDGLIFSLRSRAIRRELLEFFRAQAFVILGFLTLTVLVFVSPLLLLTGCLYLFRFHQTARDLLDIGAEYEWFFLHCFLRIAPLVHLLLIRYLFFKKLDTCFFLALKDLLHRCNAKFQRPLMLDGGSSSSSCSSRGRGDEGRPAWAGPPGRPPPGGGLSAPGGGIARPELEQYSTLPISNVDEFVEQIQALPAVSNTVDAMAYRVVRNLIGVLVLIGFYLFSTLGGGPTAATGLITGVGTAEGSASSSSPDDGGDGSDHSLGAAASAVAPSSSFSSSASSHQARFRYGYQVFQFFVIYDKLGLKRAFYCACVTFFLPFLTPNLLQFVSYFIAVSALCREVLDPVIARLREHPDCVLFYHQEHRRLEFVPRDAYFRYKKTGRLPPPEVVMATSKMMRSDDARQRGPEQGLQDLAASGGLEHGEASAPASPAKRLLSKSAGALSSLVTAATASVQNRYGKFNRGGGGNSTSEKNAPGGAAYSSSTKSSAAPTPFLDRRWSDTRSAHEPELFGFGLPLILLIAVPGVGPPVGWFAAQSAAPALFLRMWVLEIHQLQLLMDHGTTT
ncbi:unnamed protein product [Amoebophrya sp. A120]|nr:unnamed protein product [Amoebophrya sp. A120]|eukprot:GSA120T00000305001.1